MTTEASDFTDRSSIRLRTISGAGWAACGGLCRQFIQIATLVVLARQLGPSDYGLIGLVIVWTGFASVLAEIGLGTAIVQRGRLHDDHLSSAFWIAAGVGAVLAALTCAAAPLLAAFYHDRAVARLALILSGTYFLTAVGIVPRAYLVRQFAFKRLAAIDIGASLLAAAAAVTCAELGLGATTLALQRVVYSVTEVVLLLALGRWRPSLVVRWSRVRDLAKVSGGSAATDAVNYWTRNLDNVLIGRFLGSASLGLYGRAYAVMFLPLQQVSAILGQVMFASLSRIADDKGRVRAIYLRTVQTIALLVAPVMVWLAVMAHEAVLLLFGRAWLGVAPILQVLCILGIVQSMVTTVGWIYQSQGRTDWIFYWTIGVTPLIFTSFVIGIVAGSALYVAVSYAVVTGIVLVYPAFAIPGRLIGMTFADVARTVRPILVAASVGGIAAEGIRTLIPSTWPTFATLVCTSAITAAVYIAALQLTAVSAGKDIAALAQELRTGIRPRWRERH